MRRLLFLGLLLTHTFVFGPAVQAQPPLADNPVERLLNPGNGAAQAQPSKGANSAADRVQEAVNQAQKQPAPWLRQWSDKLKDYWDQVLILADDQKKGGIASRDQTSR